ncbi:MAG: STAS domain-containing protein [Armatimonadota bacterium]
MQSDAEVLQLETGDEAGVTVVRAIGDIDLSTTPDLREMMERIIATPAPSETLPRHIVLDMREVPFIDSAGLALLVEVRKRFYSSCRLALLIASATQPERVLKLGRFDTFLTIGYSFDELRSAGVGREQSSSSSAQSTAPVSAMAPA